MTAATITSTGTEEPNAATTTSANILLGMDTTVSSTRLSTASMPRPQAAAHMPSTKPLPLASTVAAMATPTV